MRIFLSSDCIGVPEQLRERRDITWIHACAEGLIPDAHLYIWDYSPGLDLPFYVLERAASQHLIVSDPKYLESLRQLQNSVCILVKPVAPFTLNAFVELAFKSWQLRRDAHEVEVLKLDRDSLLQYVLEVNLKLQQYDRERSNFLARALHDFRAPLTALHGYCGLLVDGKLGAVSAEHRQLLERMRHSTSRLARLADGTLDLLMQGRVERRTKRYETDIEQILNRALGDIYPVAKDKGIEVQINVTQPEGILLSEAEQIHQVLVNLLENSCRFTPKQGRIEVRGSTVYVDDDWSFGGSENHGRRYPRSAYQIDISDSGPGVPSELVEQIFEEYASYSGSADRSGGGLGLAICKAIITAHGGKIWAIPGQNGGKFSFTLPLNPFPANARDLPIEATCEVDAAEFR